MKGYNANLQTAAANTDMSLDAAPPANGIDWVTLGKVSPIQNQGQCGSCWSFSASGNITSRRAIKLGTDPIDYSEQ